MNVISATGRALVYLASRCDHASSEDGVGFSKFDARTGHDLARRISANGNFASDKQLNFGRKIAIKYRRQLDEAGFDLAEIRSEVFEGPARAVEEKPEQADVVIHAAVISRTAKAVRINGISNNRAAWVPNSMVRNRQPTSQPGVFAYTIPAWLAAERGLVA